MYSGLLRTSLDSEPTHTHTRHWWAFLFSHIYFTVQNSKAFLMIEDNINMQTFQVNYQHGNIKWTESINHLFWPFRILCQSWQRAMIKVEEVPFFADAVGNLISMPCLWTRWHHHPNNNWQLPTGSPRGTEKNNPGLYKSLKAGEDTRLTKCNLDAWKTI